MPRPAENSKLQIINFNSTQELSKVKLEQFFTMLKLRYITKQEIHKSYGTLKMLKLRCNTKKGLMA